MTKFWNSVLDAVNPNRKSDALFEVAMYHMRRAGAPSKVDVLFAEFEAKIAEANARMGV